MAIEIKELHIRVSVNVPAGEGATQTSAGQAAHAESDDKTGAAADAAKDAIVAECVEQVLQILHNKLER